MNVAVQMMSEVKAMLPAALTPGKSAPRRPRGRHVLQAEKSGKRLRLKLVGQVDAMDLVEDLSRAVDGTRRASRLELDLSRAAAFDNLALSAVLVVLRNHAGRLRSVALGNLPPWARQRITQTGADNIMGRGWVLLPSPQCVELRWEDNPGGESPVRTAKE